MRVISGKARGAKLLAPEGLHTRPVTDKIRESLFNIWQYQIYDASFLDLFSGSGSMGIEAISRNAKHVVMVDNSLEAIKVIKQNLKNCKMLHDSFEVLQEDVFNVISRFNKVKKTFDIIYLDPPFTVPEIFDPVMEALGESSLLNEDGSIVIRSLKELKLKEEYGNLTKVREKTYGISTVHFYKVKEE